MSDATMHDNLRPLLEEGFPFVERMGLRLDSIEPGRCREMKANSAYFSTPIRPYTTPEAPTIGTCDVGSPKTCARLAPMPQAR